MRAKKKPLAAGDRQGSASAELLADKRPLTNGELALVVMQLGQECALQHQMTLRLARKAAHDLCAELRTETEQLRARIAALENPGDEVSTVPVRLVG